MLHLDNELKDTLSRIKEARAEASTPHIKRAEFGTPNQQAILKNKQLYNFPPSLPLDK